MPRKIIIMGHGNFPRALKDTAKLLLGETVDEKIIIIELQPEDTVEKIRNELYSALNTVDEALIFADIFGGTPSRVIAEVLLKSTYKSEAVFGVNLPMLLQALLEIDEKDVKTLAGEIVVQGRESITTLSEKLSESRSI